MPLNNSNHPPRPTPRWPTVLAFPAILLLALTAGSRLGSPFAEPDASSYLDLAAGRPVMLPFAWRQLCPLLVRALSHLLHLSLVHAFLVEGTLALALFLAIVLLLLIRSRAPLWILPALAGLFFWPRQWNELAAPDLTFAALLAIFLLLLSRNRVLPAAAMLFPLSLTRESTLLVLTCLLLTGWQHLRRHEVVVALTSTAAGLFTVRLLTASALPNREHLSGTLYLLAKLPVNLLRNVFGIELWADLYPVCPTAPLWQTPLRLGPLHALGICNISPAYPLHTFGVALASFGLLPLLVLKLHRSRRSPASLLLRFCLLYGAISFLLAPLLGFLVVRLFDYAWPLFLVALPMLVANRAIFPNRTAAAGFLTLHLALSWAPWWVFFTSPLNLLEVALALYVAGWWLLWHSSAPLPPTPKVPRPSAPDKHPRCTVSGAENSHPT